MSNKPKILFEFTRDEASYIMDLLYDDWTRQVRGYILLEGFSPQYDEHVKRWRKSRPSLIMNYMDETASKQGFDDDEGKGL